MKSFSTIPGAEPAIKQSSEVALLLNGASGATNAAASSQVSASGKTGSTISGCGAGSTSITVTSVTAGLSQLPSGSTVHVTVRVPPQIVKSGVSSPSTTPSIAQAPVSPLEKVALGAMNAAASSHVSDPGTVGSSIIGSAAGVTSIVAVSTILLLSQPVPVVHVIVISPPHSVKSFITTPGVVPSIKQTSSIGPLLKLASGAMNAAASSQVSDSGNSGIVISGAGAGRTSMTNSAVTPSLSQLSDGSTE